MQIIISCAKDMTLGEAAGHLPATRPHFGAQAKAHAQQMRDLSAEELRQLFKCSAAIAQENVERYRRFVGGKAPLRQAALSYSGMAYRHLRAGEFTPEQAAYANEHLWITSFLYGLLRPMDLIHNYRMEGNIRLPMHEGKTMFDFWKPLLTDYLIKKVKADDGILVHLATVEMERLFDWKKICKEVRVIAPQFYFPAATAGQSGSGKNGGMKIVAVHAKMCRGAMSRYIIEHRCTGVEQLKDFEYEGYRFLPEEDESHGGTAAQKPAGKGRAQCGGSGAAAQSAAAKKTAAPEELKFVFTQL